MIQDNDSTLAKLEEAEHLAVQLFSEIEGRGLIRGGRTEKEISEEVFGLAGELFGIEKYWHKRIVRAGENTLCPYDENPPDLMVKEDDIVFLDLGPIFEDYEADVGRTYVLGNDPAKLKIKEDIEEAWAELRDQILSYKSLTGAECYKFAVEAAKRRGWEYGIEIAGHLVGKFPHERLPKGEKGLYMHIDNPNDIFIPAQDGSKRHWILEIQFVDRERKFGAFYEQLLSK